MSKVEFVYDSYGTEKIKYIKSRLKEDILAKRHAFWIVPEQYALECERIATELNGQLYVEVLNFTRLCNKAFRLWGDLKNNYIDASAKNLVMFRALCVAREKNMLSEYSKIIEGRERGCVELFLDAVSELKSYAITPNMLEKACESIDKNERLASRTKDLVCVYRLYDEILSASYSDPYDDLEALYTKLENHKNDSFFNGANVYISSFFGWTGAQIKILDIILKQANKVTFAFDVDRADLGKIQFDKLTKTIMRLQNMCKSNKIVPTVKELKEDSFHESEAIKYLVKNIWEFGAKPFSSCEGVSLLRPRDEFEECELVASKIRELLIGGAKYSDIAVIVRNTDTYRGIIDTALKKYGINYFISASTDATSRPLVKMLYSAINASSYWSVRDVATFMRSRYAGVLPKDADLLEDYMFRWGIYGSRFESEWKNNPDGYSTEPMSEEQSARLKRINDTRKYVVDKISILKRAFSPVENGATRGASAKSICKAVHDFLVAIDIKKSLAEEFLETKDKNEKFLISQLYSAVLESLEAICKIMPNEIVDQEGFLCALSYSLDGVEIGALPTGEDNVTIGEADSLRASGIKHAFVLGVCEGSFPANVSAIPFFSDEDKSALEDAFERNAFSGATLSENTETRADSELLMFKNSIAFPSHTLVVSAPISDIRGNKKDPSLAFTRIKALLPALISLKGRKSELFVSADKMGALKSLKVLKKAQIEALPQFKSRFDKGLFFSLTAKTKLFNSVASRIWTRNIATEFISSSSLASLSVCKALGKKKKNATISNENLKIPSSLAKENGILCQEKDGKKNLNLSQSQIEKFVNCPMQYYCDKVLGLRKDEVISFGSAEVGELAHKIFEKFLIDAKIDEGTRLSDISDEKKSSMIDEITSDYLNKLCPDKNPEQKLVHLFDRLKSNIIYYINDLALELDNSDFKPAFFEFKFSDPENGCPPRKFKRNDGVVVSMSGIADRVDLYAPEDEDNLYLRVVDYKTGEKTFKIDEFKNGREIQLPLYLSTLCQPNTEFAKKLLEKFGKKELKPASVVYFPMKIGKSSVMSPTDGVDSDSAKSSESAELIKNSKRNGFFLDSEKVLFAQDKNRGVKGKRTFLPSKTVKNAHLFLPEDDFQNAVETQLNETITKITDRLLNGEACASPLNGDTENICKYCSRLFVCRKRRKV